MNICIYTVHLFLYEFITFKVKSRLSNYSTFHISYDTTNTQKYKITFMKNTFLVGHPVALVGQAKDFHQHHIWWFPLPCNNFSYWETISLNAAHIPNNDPLWCPHMQHSWHPTVTSDLVVYEHILSIFMLKKTIFRNESKVEGTPLLPFHVQQTSP